jgi:DNA-binding IclR family transcriptional regulator
VTVEEIATKTSSSRSTTLRMLEKLERSGHVRRNDDERAFYPTDAAALSRGERRFDRHG